MKNEQIKILLLFLIILVVSCSTQRGLIKREKTEFGTIKYYVQTSYKKDNYIETKLNDLNDKNRIVIKIADSVYYSIYSDGIYKRTKTSKNSVYRLFYGKMPKDLDAQIAYHKLSELDSLILSKSDKILDSLKWNAFESWTGAKAFEEEIIYYHGFPKNGKFEPY